MVELFFEDSNGTLREASRVIFSKEGVSLSLTKGGRIWIPYGEVINE